MMDIKHERLTPRIHLLTFPTQIEIASTFLRFQEHYESQEFKGKIFSLEEFKRWYVQNSPKGKASGEFTYYQDWAGFNIPSYVLSPFYRGEFDPLSEQEAVILRMFRNEQEPFYIIGIHAQARKLEALLRH